MSSDHTLGAYKCYEYLVSLEKMNTSIRKKIHSFFSKYKYREFKKSTILISPNKSFEGVFYLEEGIVRCYSISKRGTELTINFFKPISFFPVQLAFNDEASKFYYEALVDVKVFIAPKAEFTVFISQEKDIMLDLLERIYKGLGGYFLRIESLLDGETYYKVASHLCIYSRRFGAFEKDACTIKLTHSQLASFSGLTRETVTRELKKLQKKNILVYQGKNLIILNINKLEQTLVV